MTKTESEKIDCLHRPCSRPAPRGKIESVRTHSEVIEQFDSFSLLKLLFLVKNWHCWSRKAFTRQVTSQSQEKKTAKRRFFDTADRHESCTVDRGCTPAPKDATKLSMFFRFFFESLLWHFNKKQRAEVILRFSRPVSCKKQENGSGKQRSLHAPLKTSWHAQQMCKCDGRLCSSNLPFFFFWI